MNKPRSSMEKKVSQLPSWLWSNSNVLPSVYKRIWEAVREDRQGANHGETLVDTKKVFPLLLTSQLPTEVLGYIWGLANQKYAGKLTEQELYVVLALVAVAQTSYPFTNLEVLHLLPGPPTPRLNLSLIYPNVPPVQHQQDSGPSYLYEETKIPSASSGIPPPGLPGLIPNHSHLGETRIDSKIFTTPAQPFPKSSGLSDTSLESRAHSEMKASSSLDSSDDFCDFQSAPIPQSAPSLPMLDTKQGSAIGSRLANHNLGVKKSSEKPKKSSSGSKSHGGSQMRPLVTSVTMPSLSTSASGGKELLANPERLGEMFPKCSLKNQAKTVILKDTAIRNNDPPKQIVNPTTPTISKIEIPPPKQSSSKFLTSKVSENSLQDLMNLQQVEDKYSALRILVEEPTVEQSQPKSNSSIATSNFSQSDDFGDFVSATQPEPVGVSDSNCTQETSADIFTDFERFRPQNLATSSKKSTEGFLGLEATIEAFGNLEIGVNPERRVSVEEKYEGIAEIEKVVQKEDAISVNSIELGNGNIGVLTRSSSVPSLDLKSFLSPTVEDEQLQVENMHQLIYWEWKQYMESCVLLLQTAASVFGSITSDVILQEVLASAQGFNFLCNLAEVAAVCRRVNFSHKEMDINIMGFDDLLMDIDRIWAEMEPFYANIPIVTELPVWPLHQNESAACCSLCLTVVTSGRIIYNDNSYHVTCANLWLNAVNSHLPALRYPPSSFGSHHSIPISSTGTSQI